MIEIAQTKMPLAHLIEWDVSSGLPDFIKINKYDSIISTYASHHLPDAEKVIFIKGLLPLLNENGKIFIGDVAFRTREQLETCRINSIDYWDGDELYFVYEEIEHLLQNDCKSEFHPISHCGGVIVISK